MDKDGQNSIAGCPKVNREIVPYFNKGLMAVRTDTYDEAEAVANMNIIYKMWSITYLRAALKYLGISEKNYAQKPHAEGYAYWMAIAGYVKSFCSAEADELTAALDIKQAM